MYEQDGLLLYLIGYCLSLHWLHLRKRGWRLEGKATLISGCQIWRPPDVYSLSPVSKMINIEER